MPKHWANKEKKSKLGKKILFAHPSMQSQRLYEQQRSFIIELGYEFLQQKQTTKHIKEAKIKQQVK